MFHFVSHTHKRLSKFQKILEIFQLLLQMMVDAVKLLKHEYAGRDGIDLFNGGDEEDVGEDDDDHQQQHEHVQTPPQRAGDEHRRMAAATAGDASALIPLFNAAANTSATGTKRRRQRNLTSADELPMGTLDADKPKHSYWRYFRRDRATARAECRMCGRSIQMGLKSSTGGMRRHMQSIHFGVFVEFIAERAAHPRGGGCGGSTPATPTQQQQQLVLRKRHFRGDGHQQRQQQRMAFGGSAKATQIADGAKHFPLDFDDFDDLCRHSTSSSAVRQKAMKTEQQFEPQSSSSMLLSSATPSTPVHGMETSLQNSLKMLLDNHHNQLGDDQHQLQQHLYNNIEGAFTGEQFETGNESHNRLQHRTINNGVDDGKQYISSPPASSQERLHQMVFSSNINRRRTTTNGEVQNDAAAIGGTLSAAPASSLREISDVELAGRLQIARERLKDALDMLDSLQRELSIRQQLRSAAGGN